MKSTAVRANQKKTHTITFKNKERPVFIILKILIWKGNYKSAVFIR